MLKRVIATVVVLGLASPVFSFVPEARAFNPSYIISDEEMTDTLAMTREQVQAFLESRGALGAYVGPDINGNIERASDIIYDSAVAFDLNPQFLLVLLQREQSLVDDDAPTQKQLDWAMGYAVCDDCSMDDPALQKYRGFGNQVYYAAKRIRESYLDDLERMGTTLTGIGPGIETIIDGLRFTPANFATAVLFTYTPHLHGNENFVRIWQRWFVRDYPSGSLLQDIDSGGIWLIKYGERRPITSRTAYLTRFPNANLIPVKPSTLESYTIGKPISFPNYSLLRSPRGTVFLIVDDMRRGFTSGEALRSLGFNTDEIIDVSWEDLDAYVEGEPIDVDSGDPQGELLQDATSGGIVYVEEGVKHPIMSREILQNRFPGWTFRTVPSDDLAALASGDAVGFQDGTLVGVTGSPDVFVISDGLRRPIVSGEVFEAYGWQWDRVVWTNERSVLLHDLGDPIILESEESAEETIEITSAIAL